MYIIHVNIKNFNQKEDLPFVWTIEMLFIIIKYNNVNLIHLDSEESAQKLMVVYGILR